MTSSLQNTVRGLTPRSHFSSPAFGPAVTFNCFTSDLVQLWSHCSVKVGGVKPMAERAQVLKCISKKKKEKGRRRPGCAFYSPLSSAPTSRDVLTSLPTSGALLPKFLPSSLLLALEWPGWWLSDFHWDICVQRVLLDMNQSVGQRADAVFLHCVLGVLDFIKSAGWRVSEDGGVKRMQEGEMGRQTKG